jgi:hypothetical protein
LRRRSARASYQSLLDNARLVVRREPATPPPSDHVQPAGGPSGATTNADKRTPRSVSFHQAHLRRQRLSGTRVANAAAAAGGWIVEVVKRNELHKFAVLPNRWIVERTVAWISRNHRLARNSEQYPKPSPPSSASP